MRKAGWYLFTIGTIVLLWAVFVGLDAGIGRVTSLPMLTFGSSLMIAGAVLASAGSIVERLDKSLDEIKRILGIPEELVPELTFSEGELEFNGARKPSSWMFDGKVFDSEESALKAKEEYINKYVRKGR